MPPGIDNIYIPVVQNDTTEPGLGLKFTEALRSRFERYGVVQVVESKREADAVLKAKIQKVETGVEGTTSDTDIALALELILTVGAELRTKAGQVLWQAQTLQVREDFAGVGDVVVTSSSTFQQGGISADTLGGLEDLEVSRGQKDQALEDALEEASRKIYLSAVAADF